MIFYTVDLPLEQGFRVLIPAFFIARLPKVEKIPSDRPLASKNPVESNEPNFISLKWLFISILMLIAQ